MKEPLKHTGKLHSIVSKEWLEWAEQEIQSIQSENAALKVQVKRLREALYKIIDTWSKGPEDDCIQKERIAREALADTKEPLKHNPGKFHSMISNEWLEWAEQEIKSLRARLPQKVEELPTED